MNTIHYKKKVFPDHKMMDEHRFIMEQHLGRKLGVDECVHHINEDKRDNRIENLQVMTRREHAQHHLKGKPGHFKSQQEREAIRKRCSGEGTNFHKLTTAEVIKIRKQFASGLSSCRLASIYNVHPVTIRRACDGTHWSCIPMEQTP